MCTRAGRFFPASVTRSKAPFDQEWQEVTGPFRRLVDTAARFHRSDDDVCLFCAWLQGGGANPPGVTRSPSSIWRSLRPASKRIRRRSSPSSNNAFELGTKNSLLDGSLTLNADVFLYKYKDYQISQIIDRTAVNMNFNSTVKARSWNRPGSLCPVCVSICRAAMRMRPSTTANPPIDPMDRTAGHADWLVVKPFYTETSNCIIPEYLANELIVTKGLSVACLSSYNYNRDR